MPRIEPYNLSLVECTLKPMDVAMSTFRAHLSDWIDRARAGEEIVVTDRGAPVARLIGMDTAPALERLTSQGVIGRPKQMQRPKATGRVRTPVKGSVADLVSEQRR